MPTTHSVYKQLISCGMPEGLNGIEQEMWFNRRLSQRDDEIGELNHKIGEQRAEIERLQAGYIWLEQLAEGEGGIRIDIASDGELSINEADGIHCLHEHVDLADLCTREAAEAAGGNE